MDIGIYAAITACWCHGRTSADLEEGAGDKSGGIETQSNLSDGAPDDEDAPAQAEANEEASAEITESEPAEEGITPAE